MVTVTSEPFTSPSRSRVLAVGTTLRAAIGLLKPRVVGLVMLTGLVAMLVAGGGHLHLVPGILFLVGGGMAAAGAAALNHYLDRDIDAIMQRTRRRPLPSGRISSRAALLVGAGAIVAAQPLLWTLGWPVARWSLLGAVLYVGIYTLGLKRRTSWNIVIGGFTGSCAVLGGWEAAGAPLTAAAWAIALLIFAWTPAHFWSLAIVIRDDYRRAGVPMLSVVSSPRATGRAVFLAALSSLPLSLVPVWTGTLGVPYAIGAMVSGVLFSGAALQLWRDPDPGRAWKLYKWSGLYLMLVFLAMTADVLAR